MFQEKYIFLALIQGITEFIPVSSTAHIILFSRFFSLPEPGATLEIALHLGTLCATLFYFRGIVWKILCRLPKVISLQRIKNEEDRYLPLLILSSLPLVCIGFIVHQCTPGLGRSTHLIGAMSILFGGLLWFADSIGQKRKNSTALKTEDALIIGFFQALSVIPGVSRLGACLTGSLLVGLKREEAAKWSFLLSLPAVGGAVTLEGYQLIKHGGTFLTYNFTGPIMIAFVTGLLCINFVLKWLQKHSLTPFALYRILLGGALWWW